MSIKTTDVSECTCKTCPVHNTTADLIDLELGPDGVWAVKP